MGAVLVRGRWGPPVKLREVAVLNVEAVEVVEVVDMSSDVESSMEGCWSME